MPYPLQTGTTIRTAGGHHENPFESAEEVSTGYGYDDLRDFQGAYVPVLTTDSSAFASAGGSGMGGQAYRNGIKSMYATGPSVSMNNGGGKSPYTSGTLSPLPSPPPKDDLYDERLGVVDKSRPRFNKTQTRCVLCR